MMVLTSPMRQSPPMKIGETLPIRRNFLHIAQHHTALVNLQINFFYTLSPLFFKPEKYYFYIHVQ